MSELDYMDALAAEYVLGTLDGEERTHARTLLEADEAFAAKVQLWERRFGDLHLMVEPVEPDSTIWARIRAKMPEARQQIRAPQPAVPLSAPETTAAEPASLTVAEPPSLDAIEAAIAQAATTLSAEASSAATPPPQSEVTPAEAEVTPPVSEVPPPVSEVPPAGSELTPPVSEVPPAGSELTPPVSEVPPAGSEATPSVSEMPHSASEGPPAGSDVTPTSVSEASPGPASEPTSVPVLDAPPASPQATGTSAAEAVLTPPVAAVAAAAEAPSDTQTQAVERAVLNVHRQLRRWRAFAIVMTLAVVAVAALLAAWRFAPDRVPPMLQPLEVMRQVGVSVPAAPAPRRPAPPESQFDE
jgi:anti-sigma-K factor RskA